MACSNDACCMMNCNSLGCFYSRLTYLQLWRYSSGAGWAGITKSIGHVSWVGSTPRSSVTTSLRLLALQLKSRLPGLIAPERPLFTPSLSILTQGMQGIEVLLDSGVLTTAICWSVCAQSTAKPWHTDRSMRFCCRLANQVYNNA